MKTIQMVTAPSKKQSRTLNTKGVVVNRNDVANEKSANDQVDRSSQDNPIKGSSYHKQVKLFGCDYDVIDKIKKFI